MKETSEDYLCKIGNTLKAALDHTKERIYQMVILRGADVDFSHDFYNEMEHLRAILDAVFELSMDKMPHLHSLILEEIKQENQMREELFAKTRK